MSLRSKVNGSATAGSPLLVRAYERWLAPPLTDPHKEYKRENRIQPYVYRAGSALSTPWHPGKYMWVCRPFLFGT